MSRPATPAPLELHGLNRDVTITGVIVLELLALVGGCCAVAAGVVTGSVFAHERQKKRFVVRIAQAFGSQVEVKNVESGDVQRPLAFTLGDIRIRAVVRGRVELWQLERHDKDIVAGTMAVVRRGWRAPDVRSWNHVGMLTPRLQIFVRDTADIRPWLEQMRGDLCAILGRTTRRCVVEPGHVLVELSRRGFALDDLQDAICRLEAMMAVLRDEKPILPAAPERTWAALSGPAGALVPALDCDRAT